MRREERYAVGWGGGGEYLRKRVAEEMYMKFEEKDILIFPKIKYAHTV
jgi:hypothetical protein